MNRSHMFDALDKIPDALKAEPDGFYTRFAVTFSSEEATEHGDLPDDLADGRRCFREGLLGEDVSAFPLLVSEERRGVEIRMRSSQADQSCQAPRDDHIDSQRQFNLSGAAELQGFDPTTILEHVEERLDLPPAAIPFDQLNEIVKGFRFSVAQQSPLNRLDPVRWRHLLGDQAGDAQAAAVAVRQMDAARPELLAHHSRRLPVARRQLELNLAHGLAVDHFRPQFAAMGKASIMLRANQPVGRVTQGVGTLHQFKNVGFAVSYINEASFRHRQRRLGNPLVSFDPTEAFAYTGTLAVLSLEFSRPHPGVSDTQRFALGCDDIGRVDVHASLGFVGQRAKAGNVLPVEIQLSRVLQAKNDRMLPHPGLPVLFKPMGAPKPSYIASDVDNITELMGGLAVPGFVKAQRRGKRYLLLGLRLNRDTERMVLSDLIYDAASPAG